MSGHSKWAKIKRKKGANDAKRGALFTKLAKNITLAAFEGGGDADMNFSLRLAIEKAKEANMPQTNIERAVKKGTGELNDGSTIKKIVYEGVALSGIAFIARCSTDNINRTVSEIRKVFESHGGTLGVSGSVMWQFKEKGVFQLKAFKIKKSDKFGKEDEYVPVDILELEMELLEIQGVEDINVEDEIITLITPKDVFASVHSKLEEIGVKIESADIEYIASDPQKVDEQTQQKVLALMEALDDHDDVDAVFTNIDLN